ncbi:MAG: RNA chaperone Hfq [Bacteroidia bacterium]|nr:MAG: RNA chaperone Hfq [Bacteroidia bacterium]
MSSDKATKCNESFSLQDTYLEEIKHHRTLISIYLINGIKLSGIIKGFDHHVVLLADINEKINQLIFKHAISTIVPNKNN